MNETPSWTHNDLKEIIKVLVKIVVLIAGWGIAIVIFIGFSKLVAEGRPIIKAVISGIGIVLILLMSEFTPKGDSRKGIRYQIVYFIEVLLIFLTLILFIGMAEESLAEMGYPMVAPPSP